MATPMVLTAAYLAIPVGTDLSAYTSKVELSAEVEDKDVTTFTSLGWKTLLGGLKSGQLAITWKNDITDNALDEILWNTLGLGSVQTFEVRATQSSATSSNPKYTGSLLVKQLMPITGSVGDVNEQSVTYPTSGAITRGTS